jgi:hypothetical protein
LPQPSGQLTSHAHALSHDTELHASVPSHITSQLPLSPPPHPIEWHAFAAVHVIWQLVPLHVIE